MISNLIVWNHFVHLLYYFHQNHDLGKDQEDLLNARS